MEGDLGRPAKKKGNIQFRGRPGIRDYRTSETKENPHQQHQFPCVGASAGTTSKFFFSLFFLAFLSLTPQLGAGFKSARFLWPSVFRPAGCSSRVFCTTERLRAEWPSRLPTAPIARRGWVSLWTKRGLNRSRVCGIVWACDDGWAATIETLRPTGPRGDNLLPYSPTITTTPAITTAPPRSTISRAPSRIT